MRISVLAVGRLKSGGESDLAERYAKRFEQSGRALGLGPLRQIEVNESRHAEVAARRDDEASRLIARCHVKARRVVLDERGKAVTSEEFAQTLGTLRDDGVAEAVFLIGGADGHGRAVFEGAHARLSLGPMTLPHGLARVVLLEQLYRAVTILSGHPYHRP